MTVSVTTDVATPVALLKHAARGLLRDALQRRAALDTFAPGRVNLIGEHTDYNEGLVLPCALEVGTAVAVAPREDDEIVAVSQDGGIRLHERFRIDPPPAPGEAGHWGNYLRGVVVAMQQAGFVLRGADLAFAGNVPRGAGLSSSASFSVAAARALSMLATAPAAGSLEPSGMSAPDAISLARWAQWSEHHYAGCQCGIMDQMTAAACLPGEAMLLDCRSMQSRRVTLPADSAVLVVHSGVRRELVAGEYNLRRLQCESAARRCGVTSLRDLESAALLTCRPRLTDTEFRRARHVLTENDRVLAAADALERGDLPLLGRQLRASHRSLRDDFEVTVPEVDELVDCLESLIEKHAGGEGGARMTGGGFGGCVLAVLRSSALPRIETELRAHLRPRLGGDLLLLHLAGGAR